MARHIAPSDLRVALRGVLRSGTALVEYFYGARDPVVARTVDRAARWLMRHGHADVAVFCVDMAQDTAGALDRLRVRVLPQPTTVALYRQLGQRTQLWAGQATCPSALVHAALSSPR